MEALVTRLVNRYAMAAAGIWRLNAGQSHLSLAASAGGPPFPASLHEISASHSLLGRAAQAKLPQVYQGSAAGGRRIGAVGGAKPVPLFERLSRWRMSPRLPASCCWPPPQTPDESLLALFRLHARLASIALRDAELFVGVQHNLDRLQSMVEASKVFNSTLDLSELLGKILDVAKTLTKAERGTLFLVDEKTDEIWSLIAQGMEKQEIRLPRGRGIAGHVALTGEIVNIPDAYADDRFDPEVDKRTGFRTRNILTLPIRNKAGKIVAALQLLNKSDRQLHRRGHGRPADVVGADGDESRKRPASP